jgi:2'-5' RNA ligase
MADPVFASAAELDRIYNDIELKFERCKTAGEVVIDPYLADGRLDPRRGLTLIARPSAEIRSRIAHIQEVIRTAAGDQYYYPPEDLHFTVLSVIPASTNYGANEETDMVFKSLVAKAVRSTRQSRIMLRGIIPSDDSILAKGFPLDDGLQSLRDELRRLIRDTRFASDLDRRYPIRTAHMTMVRYLHSPRSVGNLAATLAQLRPVYAGEQSIDEVQLVDNDWYMRTSTLRRVATFRLQ